MSTSTNRDRALAHVEKVQETARLIASIPKHDHRRRAGESARLGRSLKLAEVHATLAVADAIRDAAADRRVAL